MGDVVRPRAAVALMFATLLAFANASGGGGGEFSDHITDGIPLWMNMVVCTMLLSLSAIMAGLTLALLTLDVTELELLVHTQAEHYEQARLILPLRRRGNMLLSTLLVVNVSANTLFSILTAELTHGFVAFILSTALILIFAEIVPQAIFSRYALQVGARFVYLVWFFVFITAPVTVPMGLLLDWLLGRDVGKVYTRHEIKKLLEMQGKMHVEEQKLVSGALDFSLKSVGHVMVPMSQVFMISVDDVLTSDLMNRLHESGFTRVPVYEDSRANVVGLLMMRDLYLLDLNAEPEVRLLTRVYNYEVRKVSPDLTLDKMLVVFKGGKSQLCIVRHQERDVGIITFHDVIEELIGDSIMDEGSWVRKTEGARFQQFGVRLGKTMSFENEPTVDEVRDICEFLASSVPEFSPNHVTPFVLEKLVATSPITALDRPEHHKTKYIYVRGKVDTYFTLVLSGRLQLEYRHGVIKMTNGRTCLGQAALKPGVWRPRYSACVSESVRVMRVSRSKYRAALVASQVEIEGTDNVRDSLEQWFVEAERQHESVDERMAGASALGGAAEAATNWLPRVQLMSPDDTARALGSGVRVQPRAPITYTAINEPVETPNKLGQLLHKVRTKRHTKEKQKAALLAQTDKADGGANNGDVSGANIDDIEAAAAAIASAASVVTADADTPLTRRGASAGGR